KCANRGRPGGNGRIPRKARPDLVWSLVAGYAESATCRYEFLDALSTRDSMTISDTLDQLLRAALTPSAEPRLPAAETDSRDDPRVADVGAIVAEVALKRAHELNGPSSETSPHTDPARVDKL